MVGLIWFTARLTWILASRFPLRLILLPRLIAQQVRSHRLDLCNFPLIDVCCEDVTPSKDDRNKGSWVQNVIRRTQNDRLAETTASSQAGNKYSNNQVGGRRPNIAALNKECWLAGSSRNDQASLHLSKNIWSDGSMFIASGNVYVSEMGRTWLVVHAQCFPSY